MKYRFSQGVILFAALALGASCARVSSSPQSTLDVLVKAGVDRNYDAAEPYFSEDTFEAIRTYRQLTEELHATNLPPSPEKAFLEHLARLTPVIEDLEVNGDRAVMKVRYGAEVDSLLATLYFVKEGGMWKMNLGREMASAIQVLQEFQEMKSEYQEAKEQGKPAPVYGEEGE